MKLLVKTKEKQYSKQKQTQQPKIKKTALKMTENKISRAEGFLQYNTLAIVPHLLKNKNTILDLRNETSVAGTVYDVDRLVLALLSQK